MDKKSLRKKILNDRKKLSSECLAEKSDKIVSWISGSEYFKTAVNISCYYPYKNEVNLLSLMKFTNKKILFPKVVEGSRKLDFYVAHSADDFEKGAYGIMEPKKDLSFISIDEIDLFFPSISSISSSE